MKSWVNKKTKRTKRVGEVSLMRMKTMSLTLEFRTVVSNLWTHGMVWSHQTSTRSTLMGDDEGISTTITTTPEEGMSVF